MEITATIPITEIEDGELNHVEPPKTESLPRLDPVRRVFITSRGNEIELSKQPISALMAERVANDGKPQIPQKEVLLLGKTRKLEYNANDPDYLAALKEWEENQKIKGLRYVFIVGVKGQPPQEFIDEQAPFFPNATAHDMKYLWVCSQVPDEDIDKFTEALMGQMTATQKGLEAAANFSA